MNHVRRGIVKVDIDFSPSGSTSLISLVLQYFQLQVGSPEIKSSMKPRVASSETAEPPVGPGGHEICLTNYDTEVFLHFPIAV